VVQKQNLMESADVKSGTWVSRITLPVIYTCLAKTVVFKLEEHSVYQKMMTQLIYQASTMTLSI
jgi:hypothetical protein